MKHNDRVINNQNKEIEKQLSSMTAYGIDGLGFSPEPKIETRGNKDVDLDKDKTRE